MLCSANLRIMSVCILQDRLLGLPAHLRNKAMRTLSFFAASVVLVAAARADQRTLGNGPQGPVFEAQVPYSRFLQINKGQREDEWCWAASISNVFAYYGHPVSQQRVVQRLFGAVVDMPAPSARQIAALLDVDWVDDGGRPFHSKLTAAFDVMAGVNALNNMTMIQNLQANRPLIVCNTHHCMVITEITYTQFQVLSVGVFDPWPYGPETHSLSSAEMVPAPAGQLMFVGAVTVSN